MSNHRVLTLFGLSLAIAAVYLASPVIQSGDSRLVIYEADALIHHGTISLNDYGPIVDGFPCYRVGSRVLDRYPYGTALLATPVLAVVEAAGSVVGHDPTANIRQRAPIQLEKDIASLLAAACCFALALLTLETTGRLPPAVLIAILFAFGTALWSSMALGLWQHGPLILLVTIALIWLVRASRREDWRWASASGLMLGAAFVVRPTAIAPSVLIGIYILFAFGVRASTIYAAAFAIVVLPSLFYDERVYHAALNPFYFHNGPSFFRAGFQPTFLTALAGTMLSPARGLLIYSPFLLVALVALRWPRRRLTGLEVVSFAVVLIVWLTAANTVDWAGGFSYGPRLLSDALPWYAFLLVPVANALTQPVRTWTRFSRILAGALTLTFCWSVFVNSRGALSWPTQSWNTVPTSAELHPSRFWDWGDPPFLRTGNETYHFFYPTDTPPPIAPGRQCMVH